jgi:hypothetical protein
MVPRGEEERRLVGDLTLSLSLGSTTSFLHCLLESCLINIWFVCMYQVQVSYPWEESRFHARKGYPLSFPCILPLS